MIASVVPHYKNYLNNYLFDLRNNTRDNILEPYIEMRRFFELQGCELNTVDITPISKSNYIVFFDLNLKQIFLLWVHKKVKNSVYIAFEPPIVNSLHSQKKMNGIANLFGSVLTWNDDLVDSKKFFKFYYPIASDTFKFNPVPFEIKKYITTIVGNKS